MIRNVVYTAVSLEAGGDPDGQTKDEYKDKLVKYIPAEVIGFFLPVYALVQENSPIAAGQTPIAHWIVFLICILGLIGYLFIRADKGSPPRWYFYILAAFAFLAWAIGTSSLGQDLFHIPEWWNEVIVLTGIFLIPMADELITRLTPA